MADPDQDDDGPIRSFARQVIETEAAAVAAMIAPTQTPAFAAAVRLLLTCPGAVLVSGVGKAGHVARKLSATLASTAMMTAARPKRPPKAGSSEATMSASAAEMPPLASRQEITSRMPVTKPAPGPKAAATVP